MLKNILKLEGVQKLSKADQKTFKGEGARSNPIACTSDFDCEQNGDFCPGQVRCVTGLGICFGIGGGADC
ncbi:hypothetical protein [uncultured Dokdonia sp.]|uniref:hypothetical protein n=1 Tax=uncultured Dokdonia sp. TaxID=575653 RepID=UPI00262BE369|nr:hypothetical protein [uncultured Dokdonia sp.]